MTPAEREAPTDVELTAWLANARDGFNTTAVVSAVERMVSRIRLLESEAASIEAEVAKGAEYTRRLEEALRFARAFLDATNWAEVARLSGMVDEGVAGE